MNEKQKLIQEIISYFRAEILPNTYDTEIYPDKNGGEKLAVICPFMPGDELDTTELYKEWNTGGEMEQYANQKFAVSFNVESVKLDTEYENTSNAFTQAYNIIVGVKDKNSNEKFQPNRGDNMIYSDDKLI